MQTAQINSRLGCFTSSEIGKLLTKGKNGEIFGDGALTYIYEKASELLTGERKQQASSFSLEWGINHEERAMKHYIQHYSHPDEVIYYGGKSFKYFEHPDISLSGGSPDFVTPHQCGEIKVPFCTSNHIEALLGAKSPNHNMWLKGYNKIYYAQVQWNTKCTKMDSGLFLSYDPRITDMSKCMAILDIEKDEAFISELEFRVNEALKIVNSIVNG